jgi:hypothetical protein
VKVHELYDHLAEHIGAGRGEDDVYLILNDTGDRAGDTWKWAWALTTVQPADDRDAFVSLCGEVETAEMEAQTTAALREAS